MWYWSKSDFIMSNDLKLLILRDALLTISFAIFSIILILLTSISLPTSWLFKYAIIYCTSLIGKEEG